MLGCVKARPDGRALTSRRSLGQEVNLTPFLANLTPFLARLHRPRPLGAAGDAEFGGFSGDGRGVGGSLAGLNVGMCQDEP